MSNYFCKTSGKQMFPTKGDAMRALRNVNSRTHGDGAVYQCPDCHTWHITHFSYRKSKAVREFHKNRK